MKKMHRLLIILIGLAINVSSQTDKTIDSLKNVLTTDKTDTTAVWIKNLIAERYFNFNPDTAFRLWKADESEANSKIKAAKGQTLRSFQRTLAEIHNSLGAFYLASGNQDSALKYWKSSISLRETLKDDYGISLSYVNLGFLYYYQAKLGEAIKYWQKGLVIAEKIGNPQLQASALSNLGGVYGDLGETQKAIDTYLKLVSIHEKNNMEESLDSHYLNLASLYSIAKDNKSCKKYLDKATVIAKKHNIISTITQCYHLRGQFYLDENNLDSAKFHFEQGYLLAKKNQNAAILPVLCNDNAFLNLRKKNYDEALKYALEEYETGKQFNTYNDVQRAAEILSTIYERKGNPAEAYKYLKTYLHLKDSLDRVKNEKEILKNQLEFDYEREKIAIQKEQEKKDALAQAENKKNKLIIYFMSFILLLVFVAIIFVFRNLSLHKKKNRIISKQKELVEEKQKEILDSIRYAKRIQQALMPRENYIAKNLKRAQ